MLQPLWCIVAVAVALVQVVLLAIRLLIGLMMRVEHGQAILVQRKDSQVIHVEIYAYNIYS
jgi:hypothetical protein